MGKPLLFLAAAALSLFAAAPALAQGGGAYECDYDVRYMRFIPIRLGVRF